MAPLLDDSQAYRSMRQSLGAFVSLGESEWELLRAIFRPVRVGAADLLRPSHGVLGPNGLAVGKDAPPPVFFVAAGLLRHFHSDADGSVSKAFLNEGMFSPLPEGCTLAPRGSCGAEALEDSLVLLADGTAWAALYDKHPIFDRLGRKLAAWWMSRKEAQARAFQLQDAKDRYLSFIRTHPDLAQRVPQYHIASYLGMTGVSLSRIRRTLARRPAPSSIPA